ncbi:MAG: hypothetical protein Q8K96_09255 [Rubrivivax sp.]|nr:hypothetical protein [Rubrivivax sp.]
MSCAAFTANDPNEASTNPEKTRGAYNMRLDLVTALGSDLPGNALKYTLLTEPDLAPGPDLFQSLADARRQLLELALA